MGTTDIQPEPRRRRRWFQYSLRTLLAFLLLVSVGMSWVAVRMQQARSQKKAVEAIEKLGGSVIYDYEFNPKGDPTGNYIKGAEPPGPAWLRHLLGEHCFQSVVFVDLSRCQVSDADLTPLAGLTQHEWELYLHATQVTDAGLEHLKRNPQLIGLSLVHTKVTDAGLEHIRGMRQMQWLALSGTQVTDRGLEHLTELPRLAVLHLQHTEITDAGLKRLQRMSGLRHLNMGDTRVSDTGVEYLKDLTQLRILFLGGTQVTDRGLDHLRELTQFQWLSLGHTAVTDEGVKRLEQGLPDCSITR